MKELTKVEKQIWIYRGNRERAEKDGNKQIVAFINGALEELDKILQGKYN